MTTKRKVWWLLFDIENSGICDPILFATHEEFISFIEGYLDEESDEPRTGSWEDDLDALRNGTWGDQGNVVMWGEQELEFPDG